MQGLIDGRRHQQGGTLVGARIRWAGQLSSSDSTGGIRPPGGTPNGGDASTTAGAPNNCSPKKKQTCQVDRQTRSERSVGKRVGGSNRMARNAVAAGNGGDMIAGLLIRGRGDACF